MTTLKITSEAFADGGTIPVRYTCDGDDVNPPLTIENIPDGAESLVLIVDDPDAPAGVWDHWIVWNIEPAKSIRENSIPGIEGVNDFKKHHYGGPCPPSGTHRYFFKVYALDTRFKLPVNTEKGQLEKVMKRHILAQGELMGLYTRERRHL